MAKRKDKDPRAPQDQAPKDLPHVEPLADPLVEPLDDLTDAVEFVDDAEPLDDDGPISFSFADEIAEPKASDSAPHVTKSPKSPVKGKETDSVIEDDLVHFSTPIGEVSGVYSSAARQESESAVMSNSEIIRAEPLSDSVAIDPISEIGSLKADSDVRADDLVAVDDLDLVDADDAVLEHDTSTLGDLALPESAVRDEKLGSHEDAVGNEALADISDSSVSLKSFRGSRKSPEKEPVLDLDEAGIDSPQPELVDIDPHDVTEAFEVGSEDDLLVVDDTADGSSVNLGQKGPRSGAQSGIDPLAEALESGVRLDVHERDDTPSVEFDELVVDDDDIAAVDLGAHEPFTPKKASAKLPRQTPEFVESPDDAVDIDELVGVEEEPATVAEDDIDIDALIADDSSGEAPVVEDELAPVMDDDLAPVDEVAPLMEEEAPVTTPKRGKRPAVSKDVDDVPAPYEEPKKRGGWGSLLGGLALGVLLTAGAGAGVWFAAPELIPSPTGSQNTKVEPKPAAKTPLQLAHAAIDQGNYAAAIETLKDADDKTELAARGEARWLDYYKKQTDAKAPIDSDADEVKAAVDDLKKSENPLKLNQLQATLSATKLASEVEAAKKAQEAMADEFAKAKMKADEADKAIDGLKKEIADAKAAAEKGDVGLVAAKKAYEEKLAAQAKELDSEKASAEKASKERDELAAASKAAVQELVDAKLLPPDADPRKDLTAGIKAARSRAESPLGGPLASLAGSISALPLGIPDAVKHAYDDAAILAEINYYRLREAFVPTPEQQLDRLAFALANRGEKNPTLIADANKLADIVLAPAAKASPAAKAKALYVQALAQRNQEKFAEARQTLQASVDLVKDSDAAWVAPLKSALAELSDPVIYYLPRIDKLRAEGNAEAALKELNAALAAIPNHPRLMSERGLLSLESGKNLDDQTKAVIRTDAEAAAKDPKTAASGNYLLGRVEEQAGHFAKAEELYRQALKTARPDDEQTNQIRMSLGRLLLRSPAIAAPAAPVAPAAPAPKDDNGAAKEEANVERISDPSRPANTTASSHPLSSLVAAALFTQVGLAEDDDSPAAQARVKEVVDLANELIKSPDRKVKAQGHFLLGDALSRLGQRTEGLRHYARGLELLHPEAQMTRLLEEHPALSVPDSLQRANPLLAEKHYGIGLHDYREHRFAAAEAQFKQAIAYFDKDARYYYFLGLAELEQGGRAKRSLAFYAWEQASRLEASGRPNTREINLALERVQGDRRAYLNSFRGKATANP